MTKQNNNPQLGELPDDLLEAEDLRDAPVLWRFFGFIAVFMAVIGGIYAATAYEDAGTTMLFFSSALGAFCAIFLWRTGKRLEDGSAPAMGDAEEVEFMAESSIWPFVIGLGATLMLNGLLIGTWFMVPGLMIFSVGVAGFARQSRRRYFR